MKREIVHLAVVSTRRDVACNGVNIIVRRLVGQRSGVAVTGELGRVTCRRCLKTTEYLHRTAAENLKKRASAESQ